MFSRALISLSLAIVSVASSRAEDSVRLKIRHVGLEGISGNSPANAPPAWVQVEAQNVTGKALEFTLSIAELNLEADAAPTSAAFKVPVTLAAREARVFNIPLQVFAVDHAVIFVEARNGTGQALGRTGRRVGERTQGTVIALICSGPQVCQTVQQAILLSGTAEEQTRKSQSLRIVQLSEPPPVAWAYAPAATIIVASSMAKFSLEQQRALEVFLHNYGTLVLVEDQLADGPPLFPAPTRAAVSSPATSRDSANSRFLGSLRAEAPEGKPLLVGDGRLVHFQSASGPLFTNYFRPLGFGDSTPRQVREQVQVEEHTDLTPNTLAGDERAWLMKRLGTAFRFPTFLELLLWMVGYLALVGVVNFVVLRKLGRPEWGWITIPALAILFSLVLYGVSVRNHPSNFGLDEIVEYRMDPRSSLAVLRATVRVSAPVRSTVSFTAPADLVYEFAQPARDMESSAARAGAETVQEITLGEKWEAQVRLRRWSSRDLDFHGHREFAGAIFRDPTGGLHNNSGINFEQAIVVDHEDVFLLGSFSAGAVADLGRVQRLAYAQQTGRNLSGQKSYPNPPFQYRSAATGWNTSDEQSRRYEAEWNDLAHQPFSLLELIRGWSPVGDDVFAQTKAVFFGLSTEASLGTALSGRSPNRKAVSLTIVTFKDWP